MKKHEISVLPFKSALKALDAALAQPKNEFTRDASIQRFEYSFELAWKLLKRYFTAETGIEEYQIKNLFREAGHQNLIDNVEIWFDYLKARNLTSQTYNEKTAEETYQIAKHFAPDAKILLERLEKKLGPSN